MMRRRIELFFYSGLFLMALLLCHVTTADDDVSTDPPKSVAASATEAKSDAAEPPTEWIDPATGHRIIRLSREPGTSSLYFHQNAYIDNKLLVTIARPQTNNSRRTTALATIDLSTLGSSLPVIKVIAEGNFRDMVVGRKSGNVYYVRTETVDGAPVDKICATNLATHETREIATLPFQAGSGLAVNANETLLGGSYTVSTPSSKPNATNRSSTENKDDPVVERSIAARFAAHPPMKLFTVNIQSGQVNTFHPSTDWLNHIQFSSTDPQLMMFCHEGPWHEVDRIWTIQPGSDPAKLMHHRSMPYEIAGHEFFGHDGTIWYDLQTPRSENFWLASVNPATGERLWYPLERSQWSVHYNQSHDGKLFAGDGGGPDSVANRTPLPKSHSLDPPGNGQWIYLFRPVAGESQTKEVGGETVKIGKLEVEKLVDLSKHNYHFEPNVTFSPDNRWIVFRSNMHGPVHTYAVEIAKPQ
jgi:oligogalacturonide lyase